MVYISNTIAVIYKRKNESKEKYTWLVLGPFCDSVFWDILKKEKHSRYIKVSLEMTTIDTEDIVFITHDINFADKVVSELNHAFRSRSSITKQKEFNSFDKNKTTNSKGSKRVKFAEKNDNGIELHLTPDERELLFNTLRYYSCYVKPDSYFLEHTGKICEILNVLHLPEFDKRGV